MADVVYLLRHAAPPDERRNRFWGRGDPGVDAASLADVKTLPPLAWEKPTLVLSSPLPRAVRTATAFADCFNLEVHEDDDLAEADFGSFDGLTFAEIEQRYPEETSRWIAQGDAFTFPGGESVAEFLTRAEQAWKRITALPETTVAVAAHGGIIASWLCLFLGMDFSQRFAFRPAYAALTGFLRKQDGSGWEMAFFNNKA
ncbi:MAG: histidine phosphatase family protein [Planctomycetaceae bacterium]|nr:histidine phosphatase family protein [Planctomycetaceae bacterium]